MWIFGSGKEVEVANTVRDRINPLPRPNCHVLAGKTSLHEAIDLMALAGRVIANDSGLMHVAAALNRPLIGVYGSTSPLYTPPLADRVEIVHTDIERRPCFKRTCKSGHLKCLIELMPEQVIEAGKRLERSESEDLVIAQQPVAEPATGGEGQ